MQGLYQKLRLYVWACLIVAPAAQAAEVAAVVQSKPQVFQSQITQSTLMELFQSEADPELPWGSVALSKVQNEDQIIPIAWHVQWRREPGWPDPFARDASDRRQLALTSQSPAQAKFTPQAFVNGIEWRGLLQGDNPTRPSAREIGILEAEIFPSGAIDVTFKPGPEFRHTFEDLSAHMVRLIAPEDRKIPAGPASGVHYQASHSVIEHQRVDYDAQREHWRFKVPTDVLWPNDAPEPRLVFWLESRFTPRPVQAVLARVRPKPPPPPVEEN